jgi:hypothetical protein
MTEEEIKIVNKTARSNGVVGKKAILPRYIINHPWMHGCKILDFGSGPKAIHTNMLKELGMDVTPYEIGDNKKSDIHIEYKTSEVEAEFGLVFASNVINVQPSYAALRETLGMMHAFLKEDGICLFNFPSSPRKIKDLTKDMLMEYTMRYFNCVLVENYNGNIIFSCYKYDKDDVVAKL